MRVCLRVDIEGGELFRVEIPNAARAARMAGGCELLGWRIAEPPPDEARPILEKLRELGIPCELVYGGERYAIEPGPVVNCNTLQAFVDGELESDEAEAFRRHLAMCERCGARLPAILDIVAALEGRPR